MMIMCVLCSVCLVVCKRKIKNSKSLMSKFNFVSFHLYLNSIYTLVGVDSLIALLKSHKSDCDNCPLKLYNIIFLFFKKHCMRVCVFAKYVLFKLNFLFEHSLTF